MKDNIIRISIIKAFEYYISIQKHAIFLERWSLNGKELYCIGSVYFLNSNWGIEHNLPSARIYTRSQFSLKDAAENNYNDQILALKNLPHIEGITEYKDIKNDCREYNTFDAEKNFYKDPYGRIDIVYEQFKYALNKENKNGI